MIPNHYRLVREAIDRGVPLDEVKAGNKISAQLKKLIVPAAGSQSPCARAAGSIVKRLKLSWRAE